MSFSLRYEHRPLLPVISRFFGIVIKMIFDGHYLVEYKTTFSRNDTGH